MLTRLLFAITLVGVLPLSAQTTQRRVPPRFALDSEPIGCSAKGRVQDCPSTLINHIIAGGKESIPVLISQLSETRRSKTPIFDFWSYTLSGDIAFFVLVDLFTDSDGKTFHMPSVAGWEAIMKGCGGPAEVCWRAYLKKHGRRYVQRQWSTAWQANKERMNWDDTARCFRINKPK